MSPQVTVKNKKQRQYIFNHSKVDWKNCMYASSITQKCHTPILWYLLLEPVLPQDSDNLLP